MSTWQVDKLRLKRRKLRESLGPRRAKPCECGVPVSYLDSDGERWCVRCGRAVPKGRT